MADVPGLRDGCPIGEGGVRPVRVLVVDVGPMAWLRADEGFRDEDVDPPRSPVTVLTGANDTVAVVAPLDLPGEGRGAFLSARTTQGANPAVVTDLAASFGSDDRRRLLGGFRQGGHAEV